MRGAVKSMVDEYAATMIKAVMAEHRVSEKDFRNSNYPLHVRARAAAIRRLSEAGISEQNISRIMGISPTTVAYWKRPKERARRRAVRAKNRAQAEASI